MTSADGIAVAFEAESWAQTILAAMADGSTTLVNAIEELRPEIQGNLEAQERAMEKVVTLVLKSSTDTLTEDQVIILLSFLCGRLDASGLAATRVLEAIRHLAMELSKSEDAAVVVWRTLFHEGNVQAWAVNQRLIHYELFSWLVNQKREATLSLEAELVLSFVKAMGGERDPRCLMYAFRLFLVVATQWKLGAFVEEMFETVACYYPVEFKPKAEDSITREDLSAACEKCLLAHSGFAPFCYMLIDEKLTEDETSPQAKEAMCKLLARAAASFPAASLVPHFEPLLSAIRAISFNPGDKYGENAAPAREAMEAVCNRLYEAGAQHLKQATTVTVENVEPFILQAEMGLSLRAFSLLECLCVKETGRDVASRALGWALNLVQGDTTNVAANRSDVAKDGLTALNRWTAVAARVGGESDLLGLEDTIFGSIEGVRELLPKEAAAAAYQCAEVLMALPSGSATNAVEYEEADETQSRRGQRYSELLRRGIYTLQGEEERGVYLSFVSTHARLQWNEHVRVIEETTALGDAADDFARGRLCVLCASAVDLSSWETLKGRIWSECHRLGSEGALELLSLARSERGREIGVDRVAGDYFQWIMNAEIRDLASLSSRPGIWQQFGILVTEKCHTSLVESVLEEIEKGGDGERTTAMAEAFHLLVVQAMDDSFLYRLLSWAVSSSSVPSSSPLLRSLFFVRVNRGGEDSMEALAIMEKAKDSSEAQLLLRIAAAKALLIASSARTGIAAVENVLSEVRSLSSASSLLEELLDFSTPLYQAEENRLVATHLWRQRIAYQLVPLFRQELERGERGWRLAVLASLRHLLLLRVDGDETSTGILLAPFLPTIVSALMEVGGRAEGGEEEALAPFLAISLQQLLENTEKTKFSKELVAQSVHALCLLLEKEATSPSLALSVVASLRSISTRAPATACQPSISRAVKGLSRATGNRKRAVRTAAADARNRWELLTTK